MKELLSLKVLKNQEIANNTYVLHLENTYEAVIKSGQFLMLKVDGFFLKRPISICEVDDNKITLVYKILGKATKQLPQKQDGYIEVLLPLGNGFNLNNIHNNSSVDIIAGGIGIAPMLELTKQLYKITTNITVHLGYKTKEDVFLSQQIAKYANVIVYTEDGTQGVKGLPLPNINNNSYIFACGPNIMLKSIANKYTNNGEVSTEEYMACGFGICSGCAIKLKSGFKKVCTDGPVFDLEEFR